MDQVPKWKYAFYIVIVMCFFFIFGGKVHGAENQVILLVTEEDRFEQWIQKDYIQQLISHSSIGYMNIRSNHKEKVIEYYNSINAGRKWSYTENHKGAVENGLGDTINHQNLSTAFFGTNPLLSKLIEPSNTSYVRTIDSNIPMNQAIRIFTMTDMIVIEQEVWMTHPSFKEAVLTQIKKPGITFIILCPYSKNTTLTPILYHSSFSLARGLLTSNSTKRTGVIANNDIGPSIMEAFDINPQTYVQQEGMKVIENDDPYTALQKIYKEIQFVSRHRSEVIKNYTYAMIIVLVISIICLFFHSHMFQKTLNYVIFLILWIPFILLINPVFYQHTFVYTLILMLIFFISGIFITSPRFGLMLIGGSTSVVLALDLLFHFSLQQRSFLGYDPIIGARFYGVGNEYAGVLIGCLFLFLSMFEINERSILLHYGTLLFFICIMAFPFWGANFGGTVALAFGSIAYMLLNIDKKINKILVKISIGGAIFFVVSWVFINTNHVFSKSHIGLFITQLIEGNGKIFMDVLKRKLLMNLQLIRYTLWTKFLLIALITLFCLNKSKNELSSRFTIPLLASMTGAILFNDSGIIMASTIMIYLAFSLMFLYNGKSKINKKKHKE